MRKLSRLERLKPHGVLLVKILIGNTEMRKFRFSKLVRDKIVDGIKNSGNKPIYRRLRKTEYIKELIKKMLEESEELPKTKSKELIEEIADIQEIIDNILEVLGVTKVELKKEQRRKNKKAGSFKKRLFIDYVEMKEGAEWIKYYLKHPKKYPEIK